MLRIGAGGALLLPTASMDEAYNQLGQAFLDPDLDIDAKMQVLIGFFEMTDKRGREARVTVPTSSEPLPTG
jgi:hypothetical protein